MVLMHVVTLVSSRYCCGKLYIIQKIMLCDRLLSCLFLQMVTFPCVFSPPLFQKIETMATASARHKRKKWTQWLPDIATVVKVEVPCDNESTTDLAFELKIPSNL